MLSSIVVSPDGYAVGTEGCLVEGADREEVANHMLVDSPPPKVQFNTLPCKRSPPYSFPRPLPSQPL